MQLSLDICTTHFAHIHHPLESTITVTAMFLNVILLYLILRYSQFKMKAYKYILLVSCIADIWLAIIVFVVQPVSSVEES